jgi:peptidyl-prolyl cis-trans isomerase C
VNATTGCGSGTCGCAGGAAKSEAPASAPASVNGITIRSAGEQLADEHLRERAWSELLRQEAVRRGLLPRHTGLDAPTLSAANQQVIQAMLDEVIEVPTPTADECRRYYESRTEQYIEGRQVHARHILFAVTPGVDVHKLSRRAELALVELSRPGVDPGRFAQLAAELSNCPTGAQGGELGWFGPDDCAEELANELFHQKNPMHGMGLHPRLVHSRYGFHIVEVFGRKQGRQLTFEQVADRIRSRLVEQARARALHQYMQLLAGAALVEGVSLDGAETPLVQ